MITLGAISYDLSEQDVIYTESVELDLRRIKRDSPGLTKAQLISCLKKKILALETAHQMKFVSLDEWAYKIAAYAKLLLEIDE